MRSVIVTQFGGPEVLTVVEHPEQAPQPHEVRVGVAGSAVNPIDLSTRAGRLVQAGLMAPAAEIGMGWDVAGRVLEVGSAVRRFARGDAVVGLRDLLFAPGAHADSVLLDESALAPAPARWTPAQAGTLALNGLTAHGALAATGVGPGGTVLVTGAVGGVGGFVLELARHHGVDTVAAVRPDDADLAAKLGATHVVAATEDLGRRVRAVVRGGVDGVVDAALLGIEAHGALRSGGTFVTLVRPFAPPPIRATRVVVFEVAADGDALTGLAGLADAGVLTPRVAEVVPLGEAARAHELVERGGLRGRVVLVP
ncbi:MAG TPA: NADP-dependent oxidoreductase [Pseudonocardia sp.]|nr:NADP-dependent oxidoreductase [Pseudonocardia sp.]